ncbi:G protein-coupled glucose receptor regulating Gpa2-domain-containing protein [Fusarium oxysporum II5]|uniref:Glucose receptor Git3-like N-terminal domain-containing protein n=1 Tax=Fusarium oxysporum f. sp. cubense TaxID=61366 RepID=A0A5C6ST61_FUSOC|nr:G protein-coupled glucose receptor regulating Gpa2-domain-containing protein [Fusarium oxysporum II5]TXC01554.1 hypothetical protein FocTR4_00007978 [Fusarium oxysporum f. sp. cubense]
MSASHVDLAITVPTLVGSVLSTIAIVVVLSLHAISPPRRHVRHALIINLLLCDLADMINNTISGSLALKYGPLDQVLTKRQCTANAWVGQLTVQTIDFNILFISITVLLTVQKAYLLQDSSLRSVLFICLCAWIPGIITSFTALGLQAYGPVGGNWCWIQAKYPILRWSLSFGWRLCIFFLVIGIYTTVYVQLKRAFGHFGVSGSTSDGTNLTTDTGLRSQHVRTPAWPPIIKTLTVAYELGTVNDAASSSSTAPMSNQAHCYSNAEPDSSAASASPIRQPAWNRASPNLRRMMLLNGYPLGYLILWTPGVINRFIEIKGKSPPWLVALLASTQYIGLVHAITYGYNEQFRRSIQSWKVFRQRRERIED